MENTNESNLNTENQIAPSQEMDTNVITPSSIPTQSAVMPSCGCDEQDRTAPLVYAIGTMGVDFGTDAVLDSFKFYMQGIPDQNGEAVQYPDPNNPYHLLNYLRGVEEAGIPPHMYETARITWTISQNGTPIYAIQPSGSFSEQVFEMLVEFLEPVEEQDGETHRMDLCSFPGEISGAVKLRSGQVVPVIRPNLRAMYNWRVVDLVEMVQSMIGEEGASGNQLNRVERLANRLTYQLQNFGTSSADRALNHTATNLYNVSSVIANKLKDGFELDTIKVERSMVCRPDSDCQDVLVTFFNPSARLEHAKHVFRFTVDVSKLIPVSIGTPRDWYEY